MDTGRLSLAHKSLAELVRRRPDREDVRLQLGLCEVARGSPAAALATLSAIPANSPHFARAAGPMARAALSLGRIGDAERVLRDAAGINGPDGDELSRTHVILLNQLGRPDEARRLLEARWRLASGPPAAKEEIRLGILKAHLGLDLEPFPLELNMNVLESGMGDPVEGDAALLSIARANLSVRSGAFDQARATLEPLLSRPADNLDAWKAWLNLALAAGQPVEAARAASRLPASSFDAASMYSLEAWFAARRHDSGAERRALEGLLMQEPGRADAMVRLSLLALEAGDHAEAERYRRQKDAHDRDWDRYLTIYKSSKLAEHLEELAGLADQLGRPFEARAFREIIAAREPGATPASPAPPVGNPAPARSGATLAQALGLPADPHERDVLFAGPSRGEPGALPRFVERTREAGLERFLMDNGTSPIHQLPEMSSGGAAAFDYDGDGRLDLFLVQGGAFPPADPSGRSADRLFRNRGDGTFEDVTTRSRIAAFRGGYGHAVAVGDYDNDGHPDLFVTRWRSYALFRNRGDGTFEDVTEAMGLGGERDWPTSAAFADLDNDGDLDLYVCHYGAWDPDHPRLCKDPSGTIAMTCNPREVDAMPDHVFRNEFARRFVDVTHEAGMDEREGRGLGVVAADLDGDSLVDLFVANDTTANFFWRNLGGFRFEERAHLAGLAANAAGGFQAGMGVACGDADGDGRPDLAVTNFYDESTTLYANLGDGFFADRSAAAGLAAPTRFRLGFGISFLDANNDGHLDLMIANGYVSDIRPLFPYAMPIQLFLGDPSGRLAELPAAPDSPFRVPHVGRGLVTGDFDDDGLVDALVVAQNESPVLLKNESRLPHAHSLCLKLRGVQSNRDGVGTRVTVEAAGRRWVSQRMGGGSYASASDGRLHFGLGSASKIDSVRVKWPSGHEDRFRDLKPDGSYEIREGDGTPRPLARQR